MFAPYWMMQNLLVDEGALISVESAVSIPGGIYCQFQPHAFEFLDIAAQVGPKVYHLSA
jgi:ubiquitin fusion degradation protein 1